MAIQRNRKSPGLKNLTKFLQDTMYYGLERTFGLYYSSYRGYVYNNEDPDHLGRLQLLVPLVDPQEAFSYWAFPRNNFSGNGYGMQCIPEKGDLVWVTFERGSLEKPVWEHGHFGKGEKPDNLKNIKNFWFKTPGGNLVELDDSTGEIRITNKAGLQIVSSDKGISLVRNDKNISLGQLDESAEPALLGNKTESYLENISDELDGLANSLTLFSTTVITVSAGPMEPLKAPATQLGKDVVEFKAAISLLKETIKDLKSKYTTLD